MAKVPGKRQLSSDAKKALILVKSLELFRKYGYEKITVSDICKECNVNVGTIYHFFGSKLGILQALSERIADSSGFEEKVNELVSDPYAAIRDFLLEYAKRWEMLGADLTVQFFKNFQQIYISPTASGTTDFESVTKLTRFIKAAQEAGKFDPSADPKKTADLIMLIGRGVVYDWCMQNGAYNLSDKALEVMEFTGFKN